MKFYLASNFELVDQVKEVAAVLWENGHPITVEWWHINYKLISEPDELWYVDDRVKKVAARNSKGIQDCDALILVASSEKPSQFTGANIELGFALALDKTCFSVGKLIRSAMYVPVKQYQSIFELLYKEKLLKPQKETTQ